MMGLSRLGRGGGQGTTRCISGGSHRLLWRVGEEDDCSSSDSLVEGGVGVGLVWPLAAVRVREDCREI
jgi:hypothetical protein